MDAGELVIVVHSPVREGLRDLLYAREEMRCARADARHRIVKALLRDGHVYHGRKTWGANHRAWVASRRLNDELAQAALEHARDYLVALDAQIAALDGELERVAATDPWAGPVDWLRCFRGISTRTALELLAGGDASRRVLFAVGERKRYRSISLHDADVQCESVSVPGRGM